VDAQADNVARTAAADTRIVTELRKLNNRIGDSEYDSNSLRAASRKQASAIHDALVKTCDAIAERSYACPNYSDGP
jgi:hypothetical protein